MAKAGPDTTSSDYDAMAPYWKMVSSIIGGASTMRLASKTYLPQFPNETDEDYNRRVETSTFVNIFNDIADDLSARPFTKPLTLDENENPKELIEWSEDIDGHGNDLHTFAAKTFFNGLTYAIDWILVDYPVAEGVTTKADEKEANLRPYWVSIAAEDVLAVYSEVINGREEITHARIRENEIVLEGFEETVIERVRVFERGKTDTGYGKPTYKLYEKKESDSKAKKNTWEVVREGSLTIDVIPMVPFVTSERSKGHWNLKPPLKDAAELQVAHYQDKSGLDHVKEMTCFPMLTGNGVSPPVDAEGKSVPLIVGPKTVLYAPSNMEGNHGSWGILEPSAESLRFLSEDLKETAKEIREIGRQPLTANSGNLTVVTTAFAAQKGNSAVQQWALALQSTLVTALNLTARWTKLEEKAKVNIHTDFEISMHDDQSVDALIKMRERGEISRETYWSEMKRRNILSPKFNSEEEEKNLLDEIPDETDDDLMKTFSQDESKDDPDKGDKEDSDEN